MSGYTRIFDPPLVPPPAPAAHVADRAAAEGYVYDEPLVLAVNVALATGRPLLLRGRPGTGKSSVARNVALHLRRRYLAQTISSRTQARDLLWTVDDVERLSDATGGRQVRDRAEYVRPGVLWHAFDPVSARRHAGVAGVVGDHTAAVVLLDEIDKADPDVPNDLLEPLGLYRFPDARGEPVDAVHAPLVVLTTNEERDLPKAFLRRCVVHELRLPTRGRLLDIAAVRLGPPPPELEGDVADVVQALGGDGEHVDVSIAEFLDVVAATRALRIRPGHPVWADVLAATTSKS